MSVLHVRDLRARNSIGLLSNPALLPDRNLLFLFLMPLDPLRFVTIAPCLNLLVSVVEISQSKFLIHTPLHHRLQLLIIGFRYLLMNFHVFNSNTVLS